MQKFLSHPQLFLALALTVLCLSGPGRGLRIKTSQSHEPDGALGMARLSGERYEDELMLPHAESDSADSVSDAFFSLPSLEHKDMLIS